MVKYIKNIKNVYGYKLIFKWSLLISIMIVFLDKTNFFTNIIKLDFIWILFLIIVLLIIKIVNIKTFKMIILKSINSIDIIFNSLLISETIILVYSIFLQNERYKLVLTLFSITFTVFILLIRCNLTKNKNLKQKNTVYDLQDIYQSKINIENGNIIMLEEKEVDYDLLDRKDIINQLFNTIINCYPKNTFTIGLDGKWGSGKTTIINNVLNLIKKNNIEDSFVIVKFDPWEYDNEKAMLKGLIEQIIVKMNLNMEIENINSLINSVIDVIFFSSKTAIQQLLKVDEKNITGKIRIENIINNYLIQQNKRMILIIDNLDRIDTEKLKFMLKIIATTLNFKNTINVLLYDNEILEKELDKNFGTSNSNRKYMEKIIQLKIAIPPIDSDLIEQLKIKILNNIQYFDDNLLNELLTDNIKFDNIREFKRFINLIFSSVSDTPMFLNYIDFINLEYIKSQNSDLYYDIWNNKTFYISDDRKYDSNIYTLNLDKLNNDAKEHFNNVFSIEKNKKYIDNLVLMFPNVKNYISNKNIFGNSYIDKTQYDNGIKENRIFNTRYFDLYFTKNSNIFIRLNENVSSFIKIINKATHKKNLLTYLNGLTSKYNLDEVQVFMEIFELQLEKIKTDKHLLVLTSLYEYLNNIHIVPTFFGINGKERIEIIISTLLTSTDTTTINLFCDKISTNYKNINALSQIIYWMKNNKNKNEEYIKIVERKYNKICLNIVNNQIDLYSNDNYVYGNIWGIYHFSNVKVQEYINNLINENNIYRLLNDIVSHSVGTKGYGYSIRKSNIDALCPDINIDLFLKKHTQKLTNDENFLKTVYELYLKTDSQNTLEDEIILPEYRIIVNI